MNRISSALFSALLTVSLVSTAGCVGEMDDGSLDTAEEVEMDSEAMKIGFGGDPAREIVLGRREIAQVDEAGNEQQNFTASSPYTTSNTSSALVNTVNYSINLFTGDTLTIGTCDFNGSWSSGDTFLRLVNPFGTEVAISDDANLCGNASKIVYTASTSGTYLLRAGCYANTWCNGGLGYSFSAPLFSFNASNTNNATTNTTNRTLTIGSFNSLKFGTSGIFGAFESGFTYLRLYNASNQLVVGPQSQLTFSNSALTPGTYTLRAGCYGNTTCSGTVAYYLE